MLHDLAGPFHWNNRQLVVDVSRNNEALAGQSAIGKPIE